MVVGFTMMSIAESKCFEEELAKKLAHIEQTVQIDLALATSFKSILEGGDPIAKHATGGF